MVRTFAVLCTTNTSHHYPGEQKKLFVVETVTNDVFQCCLGVRVKPGHEQHPTDPFPSVWSVVASPDDAVSMM